MKLLLITSVVCFAAALAAPADKQKREILPGDPRYGTDYHHHHHHHHNDHDNEVQISKAAGGYVGSITVPDETEGHSQPHTSYGPPNYNPGKPLGSDYATSSDKNTAVQVPATSYGIPDVQLNNNYLEPATEEKTSSAVTVQTNLNADYQAPSVEAPITSYVVKHEEPVEPQTSYRTGVKTVYEHPPVESVQAKVPEVHHEVHHVSQVKATTLPIETQGVHHSVSSLPSYTSSINSFPNYFYSSYPSYSSYSSIPVRTVDHNVQVQVPQPYPVPVTKHVSYPVPVPHPVEVPKPYYVRVAQPVPVTVNRPYAVEVPRAVPYPVPHYVRTNVPVVQHQPVVHHQPVVQHLTTVDATKASNPIEGFFENAQTTFQNVVGNLPTFQNPFDGFQNPFQNIQNAFPNFQLPNFPGLPSFPSATQPPAPANNNVDVPASTHTDSIAVDNPVLKTETIVTKPIVHHARVQTTQFKPATTCAGCSVSATQHHISTKQKEHVHSTDANGGYNY